MPIVLDQLELQTHDELSKLHMSDIEKFPDGSGYRCMLTVRSRAFSCQHPFYFDEMHLLDAVEKLRSMDQGTPGVAIIKGAYDDDYISFSSNPIGHVVVSGELYEHSERPQLLKFMFRTDQTILGPLIRDLDYVLRT